MDQRMTPKCQDKTRRVEKIFFSGEKKTGVALENRRWINRRSFSESATGLIKQPGGRNNKGVLGRFRGAGFGQEFPNDTQKRGRGKEKRKR